MPDTLNLRTDLTISDAPEIADSSPLTYLAVTLDAEVRPELETWLRDHWDQIEVQMQDTLTRFVRERNQFDGKMPGADYPYAGAFRVNYPVTKRKVREVSNRRKQAYLDSDPIWAITTDRPDLQEVAQDIEQGLDTAVDHDMESEDDLAQAEFESTLHGVGLLEPGWEYLEDTRRRVETYEGWDGKTIEAMQGLVDFETTYPDWREQPETRALHAKIATGKTQRFEASYVYPTRNQPTLRFIPAASSRVYPSTDGYAGLRTTPVYGYVKTFTHAELKELADQEFIDPEQYERLVRGDKDSTKPVDQMQPYDLFIATIRYQLPGDARIMRYKVWQEKVTKAILRVRAYPWWYGEPDLIPLYLRQEEPGFYKPGLAEDLKDDHTVMNTLLNMFLNGADMVHAMKFKVKQGSLAERHLLRRAWSPHIPMPYEKDPSEVDPMPTSTASLDPLMSGLELMRRQGDEATGTTSLQSGRESPTDPSAPGNKTALLLQQVEPNTKEFIRSMQQGFRQAGRWVVWLYYQGTTLGWIDAMPGAEGIAVEELPELADALNPRAMLFEGDRVQRQQRNLALLELFLKVYAQRPDIIGQVFRVVLSQWDSEWARRSKGMDLELMPPQAPGMPPGGPAGAPATEGPSNLEQMTSQAMTEGNGSMMPMGGMRR